jgi:alpha-tubulin suppressor-like RCC1 family protein
LGITNAVSITSGAEHNCAVLQNGSAKCWGYDGDGQLGIGYRDYNPHPVPEVVSGLSNAVQMSAGQWHTCALIADGSAKCWGDGSNFGQLGTGTYSTSYTPVSVSGLANAISIAAGGYHNCALLSNGSAKCWGYGDGQIGDGTLTDRLAPVDVLNLTDAVGIFAGDERSCALLANGSAKCWGWNRDGDIGDGTITQRTTPVDVLNYSLGGRFDKSGGMR